MLQMQEEVYEGTLRLDKIPAAERTHNQEIESSRLSSKESQIVVEVDKAALLLREDGGAVAFPEAVEQMRDDMQQVVSRLAGANVGKITQGIEEDIIAALKDMIAALKKAQKDQDAKKKKPGESQSGEPQEPPLIDMLAELRMIRTLQMRVNTRTARYSKLVEGEQAENPELVQRAPPARRAARADSPRHSRPRLGEEPMNDRLCTPNGLSSRRVPLLGTSSAAAAGNARHCLFQAVAHRWAIFPPSERSGLNGLVAALLAASSLIAVSPAPAQVPLPASKPAATWREPRAADVEAQARIWLNTKKMTPDVRAKADAIWSGLSAKVSEDDLLIRLARTFALADPKAAKLAAICSEPRSQLMIPAQPWLRDGSEPPLLTNNMRLLFARWLVEQWLFDEALEQLSGLSPSDVVAPASLLFYQSVVYHALLNKESGLKSIDVLLQGADATPRRYVALAQLMQDDLKGLEVDTLDHIARRMDDVRRRLNLGRAGPKVRKVEKGVIESLDKLIKKKEEEQQQQDSSANSNRSSRPAEASRPMGGKGPGEVTKKNIGSKSGWGDMPPKEREEAMQQIGRDFPAHYRDAIEQYFRRLAAEDNEEK